MAAWATVGEVVDTTGIAVSTPQLAQAQAVIELFVNRTPAGNAAYRARDLYWLKQAVCWQAVWQKDQPGFATRSAVTRVNQDGALWEHPSQAAVNVAPLAIRAIKNLSWMGNRTVGVSRAKEPLPAFTNEASDNTHLWKPL